MTVNQISIFIENKYGKLADIFSLLASADIRVVATTVADTSEFGILRIIVNEPHKAYKILKEANVSVNLTEVFAIKIDNTAESLAKVLQQITQKGISVEYIYCFSHKEQSMLILRTNNESATRDAIRTNNLEMISESELINM